MALKVWLPLNGNLDNLGTDRNVVPVVDAALTYVNNGKIGQAVSIGSVKINAGSMQSIFSKKVMSICFWIYINADTGDTSKRAMLFGNNSPRRYSLFQYPTCNDFHWSWAEDTSNNISARYDGAFPSYQWTHCAITYDGENIKIYLNGELKRTQAVTYNPVSLNYDTYLFSNCSSGGRYLNDYRIYDHCLSALEVKEISQGLILHYKLDGFNGGIGENLISNSEIRTLTANGSNQYNYFWAVPAGTLTIGETYTFSAIAKITGTNAPTKCTVYNYHTNPNTSGPINHNFIADGVTRDSFTFVANATGFLCYAGNSGSTGGFGAEYRQLKLEKGNIATPWIPTLTEMGKNLTKVVDSSGYGNDGIIAGNVDFINNNLNGRYNITAYIPVGSTDYITTINPIGNPEDAITMSIWFKSANTAPGNNYHEIFNHATSSQYFEFAIQNTGLFRGGMVIDGTRYVANTAQLGLLDGNWHMLSMTYDGTTLVRYVDGISRSTTSIAGKLTGKDAKFMIGHYGPNTNYHAKEAYIADARIYATALSAEDILTLYNTSAHVDKLGKAHSFEFIENINNKELMTYGLFTAGYGDHNHLTRPFTNYNDKGEMTFNKTVTNAGSEYFKVNPSGKTYYYDIIVSVSAGNQFYIGFQRYDAAKTARSNNATVYVVATKPTSDAVYQRYKGTVDLSTDGVNPCDTISLRVLNNWTNSTSDTTGLATIHYLSLREVTGTPQTGSVKKNGQFITDEFIERDGIGSLYKNGIGGFTNIIEK